MVYVKVFDVQGINEVLQKVYWRSSDQFLMGLGTL